MNHLRKYQYTFLALVLMALAGCQYFGVPKPETFNQKLATGYATVTTIRQTATTLLQADKITVDDAQKAQDQCDNFRAGLDIARSIAATDPQGADTRLQAAIVGLNALNAYLAFKGAQ